MAAVGSSDSAAWNALSPISEISIWRVTDGALGHGGLELADQALVLVERR